ncbi:F-box domain-containing protein [Psidium guajava]|nr:F-box domain-containing protein [Psidium guajava]
MAQTRDRMAPAKSGDALPDDDDERDGSPPPGEEGALNWKRQRRRRGTRKREDRDLPPPSSSRDPLEVFGADLMVMILNNLDARSVALSMLVSRAWHSVASSDRLWSLKCEELWSGKAHIPRISQVHGLSKLASYSLSVLDGKRTRITKYDLCDHAWEFHFSKAAPEYWLNLDPYWKGTGPPMRRYFHLDGSQTADPGDTEAGLELGNVKQCFLLFQCA